MTETFQLTIDQAQAYEDLFVPALFAQWAPSLVDCARARPGQRVLDVACGTGVAARAAKAVVGTTGSVCGLDLNPAMLEVARRNDEGIEWCEGDAQQLPFADAEFDVVLCQSALFFFPHPREAVHEMARVTAPGGWVALQTYASLEHQPGYRRFVDVVVAHSGPEARGLFGTYWSQGDLDALADLMESAGLDVVETRSRLGTVAFPSVDAIVHTEIQATPLANSIGDEAYKEIVSATRLALREYVGPNGEVALPIRAQFIAGHTH